MSTPPPVVVDHSHVTPAHSCRLPRIVVAVENRYPPVRIAHPVGSRATCPACGAVWIVVSLPDDVGWQSVVAGHLAWRLENRRERRRRLGLPWWRMMAR